MEIGIIFPYYFSVYLKRHVFKLKKNTNELISIKLLRNSVCSTQILQHRGGGPWGFGALHSPVQAGIMQIGEGFLDTG